MANFDCLPDQHNLLDHIPNGICIVRKDWTVCFWNHTLQEWTGLPKSAVEGKQLSASFPQLAKLQYLFRLQPLFEGGPPVTFSPQFHAQFFPALLPGGHPRIQYTIAKAIRTQDGREWQIMIVVQDVSSLHGQVKKSELLRKQALHEIEERKKTEGMLQTLSDRLLLATSAARMGIWEWDISTNVLMWDEHMFNIYRKNKEEFTGTFQDWAQTIHPEDLPHAGAEIQRACQEKTELHTEFRIIWPDQSIHYIQAHGTVQYGIQGQPIRMIGFNTDITEQRRAEKEIVESESRFRLLADNVPVLIWMSDVDKKRTYFNNTWLAFTGRCIEEELGDSWAGGVHPDDYHERLNTYSSAFDRRESFNMEYRLKHCSGNYRWIVDVGVPRFDPDKNFIGYIGSCLDVTEAKDASEARERLEHAINQGNEGVALLNEQGEYTYMNPAHAHMYGFEPHDLLGKTWHVLYEPEEIMTIEHECFPALKHIGHWSGELLGRKMTGEFFPVEISWSTLTDRDGEMIGLVCTCRDVTERKRADQQFRLVVESAPSGMLMTDSEGKIVLVNQLIETMFGHSREELLGQTIEILIPKRFRRHHQIYRTAFFTQPKLRNMRSGESFAGLRKDGTEFPIEIGLNPLETDNGTFVLAAVIDISDRREVENQMALVAKDLERNNHELSLARDEALAAVKAKAEFLATMSHEIRTPMNGVIGMIDILLDTSLTDEQRELAGTVKHSGELLLYLLNDILDFSKNEAGKLELEIIDFDLRAAVEEVLELLAERASNKGLELVALVYATTPVALQGDPARIRQVLMNLVGNAIKFTETGEIVVQVSVEKEQDDDIVIRFAITDTGIGLSEEAQGRLFQSFTQADSSTTRKYGGTGLGLAICKQIVTCMGGDIGVRSTVEEGSEFWFTIHLKRQKDQVSIPLQARTNLHGVHACLVESNDTVRFLIHHYAQSWGMTCTVAANAEEALELLRTTIRSNTPCDLVIIDQQLSDMSGFDFARTIKADPMIAHSRLIMLSSLAQRGEARMAKEAGFMAYLTKPVRQEQLYRCLTTAMGTSPQTTIEDQNSSPTLITRHTLEEAEKRSRVRILLAEDNIVNQKVATKILDKLGYRVDVVANGREATEAVNQITYDVILMDCQMPEMDGYQATQEIRRREALNATCETSDEQRATNRRVPIIALTANAMKGDRERCLEYGMDDFVSKPINVEQLAETLGRWTPQELSSQQDLKKLNLINEESSHTSYEADQATPLDMHLLNELRLLGGSDDPVFFTSVIDQFLEDIPRHLYGIRQALATHDADNLMKAAHGFKGSCRNIGAKPLADLCFALEQLGREGTTEGAEPILTQLEAEKSRVQSALQIEMQTKTYF